MVGDGDGDSNGDGDGDGSDGGWWLVVVVVERNSSGKYRPSYIVECVPLNEWQRDVREKEQPYMGPNNNMKLSPIISSQSPEVSNHVETLGTAWSNLEIP
ncbi:hypothetical protein HZH66_012866 [Vespula vulgaris]|uniref:Uncharacterized protein n=1 Tax=Vespula vulgaris TaxID=7454 RepID=A0A834J9J5_VESVU|nr:hypothetical protein HZH66_012866 [Vespula vulgaris]